MNELGQIGAGFSALLGLAFGSFLNVCLTRWPKSESVAAPRSHCRNCQHQLAWWENLPLSSWLALGGRCRECRASIGLRYPLVEAAVALLWTGCWIRFGAPLLAPGAESSHAPGFILHHLVELAGYAAFCWLLVALAVLDAEEFWLPDWLTLPGVGLGFVFTVLESWRAARFDRPESLAHAAGRCALATLAGAAIVLFIRLAYWIVRRREGMGLGDAKLMAMLGAWLGIAGAVECFAGAVFAASAAALAWLGILLFRRKGSEWGQLPMPLGTFLALAALVEIFFPRWLLHWLWNWPLER